MFMMDWIRLGSMISNKFLRIYFLNVRAILIVFCQKWNGETIKIPYIVSDPIISSANFHYDKWLLVSFLCSINRKDYQLHHSSVHVYSNQPMILLLGPVTLFVVVVSIQWANTFAVKLTFINEWTYRLLICVLNAIQSERDDWLKSSTISKRDYYAI